MKKAKAKHTNIIVVLTDDQGYWAMGCAGNKEIRTPNLDRLAATGTRFDNFFCTSPVCSPARASILTGRIPSQHGVHDWLKAGNSTIEKERNGKLIEYLKGQPAYTDILAEHGYTCGISGKWHLGDAHHSQKSFRYWNVHAVGGGNYYGAPMIRNGKLYNEPGYVTDVITDNALQFLDRYADKKEPFYLSLHYTAPHSPWSRDQHPEKFYNDYYMNCPFKSIPCEPIHPNQVPNAPVGRNKKTRQEILSGYFAAVTAMDTNIGRILEWLETRKMRENTLIIFTSDNGMNMGHHGIYGKGNGTFPLNMFDTSVKVPMIISRPGHVPGNKVCSELLSHYDIMPTLLDYIGMKNPYAGSLPGQTFAELLKGQRKRKKQYIVVFDEYGPVRMIRSQEWKYIHRYPYGPNELYNSARDPDEKKDLIDQKKYAATVSEMKKHLDEWFLRYADPSVDGIREPVTGRGQIGLAGTAANGEKNFTGI